MRLILLCITNINIKLISQPFAGIQKIHLKALHYQPYSIGRKSAGIAMAAVLSRIKSEARMMIIMMNTEGPLIADAHT